MDQKILLTVLVSIFAACGVCNRFKGIPILFPTNVFKPLKSVNSEEQKPFAQYVSHSERDSLDDSVSHLKPEMNLENPSVPSKARYANPYRPSSLTDSRSLYSSVPNDHYNSATSNDITSFQKTFAQREVPPCAKSSKLDGLCEEDSDYDSEVEERFAKALQNTNVSEQFYETILSKMMVETSEPFTSRIGSHNILEDPVCPSSVKTIFPKRGMTKSNEWVFLLNQGKLKQTIKVEECLNNSGFSRLRVDGDLSCGITTDTGGESVCRQKFIFKNMIAMDRSGTEVVTEAILIPSCCVCLRKLSANRVGNRGGLEFDEFGRLITELPPTAPKNNFEAPNQKEEDIVNDDEDFSFGMPSM